MNVNLVALSIATNSVQKLGEGALTGMASTVE
jgi:hypothetical protein